jgi:hypothetical protein
LSSFLAAEVAKPPPTGLDTATSVLAARALDRAGDLSALSLFTHIVRIMAFNKARAAACTFAAILLVGATGGGFSTGWRAGAVQAARQQWEADARAARRPEVVSTFEAGQPPARIAPTETRSVAAIVETAVEFFADGDSLAARERGVLAVQSLLASEVAEALDILEMRVDLPEAARHAVAFHALALLTRSDPSAALGLADAHFRSDGRYGALYAIAQTWAPTEPAVAWQWLLDSAAGDPALTQDNRRGIASVIAAAWARHDPHAAVAAALSSDTAWARSAAWGVARAVDDASVRPKLLEAVVDAAGEPAGRHLLFDTIKQWARLDPEAAAAWVVDLEFPSADEKMRALGSVAKEWMDHDRLAAAGWMLAHAPAEFKDALAARITEEMSEETGRAR